jgi:hypothetical protein
VHIVANRGERIEAIRHDYIQTLGRWESPCAQRHRAGMFSVMIHTAADAQRWLEAKGGTWTKVRTAEGWQVIAWVGPVSQRREARESSIDLALVEAVERLERDPVLS